MGAVDVSIIVVSYNTRDLTLAALRSIYAQTRDPSFEVLLVDNASRDDSALAVAQEFPQVALRALPENLGFGAGVNLAAREAGGRYLLLLNPDTRVLDHAIDRLVELADAKPERGIYGGLTRYEDGRLNPSSCWNRPTLWSAFAQASGLSALFRESPLLNPQPVAPERLAAKLADVDIVSGGFLLIRRDLWHRLGGFDPDFFMYGEDFDLCLRARALGARPCVFTAARIVHHGGASEPEAGDKLVRLLRAQAILFRKHWGAPAAALGVRCLQLWMLTRRIGYRAAGWAGRPRALERARAWDQVWSQRRAILRREAA
jgi:hypothetical protein